MAQSDADWVAVELEAGTTYEINLSGRPTEGYGGLMAEDTVLMLLDSKGGMIAMNDDINPSGNDRCGYGPMMIRTSTHG